MGTGDGRAVLARAAAEPRSLVIGVDASAAAMADASRRAARSPGKGGLPNAIFVVAAAEAPPPELTGLAAVVTVTLPWGSLLEGVMGRDPRVAKGLARMVATGGAIESLFSTAERDGRGLWAVDAGCGHADAIASAWREVGLELEAFRSATPIDLAGTPSSWARRLRLGAPGNDMRAAWRLTLRRASR